VKASTAKRPHRIIKNGYGHLWSPMVTYGHLCLREGYLSFINSYMIYELNNFNDKYV
jgi:hypothetical protein